MRPDADGLFTAILEQQRHPDQAFRNCLGILWFYRWAGNVWAEAVSTRALEIGALACRSIASILDNNLDRPAAKPADDTMPLLHSNLRGPGYYH